MQVDGAICTATIVNIKYKSGKNNFIISSDVCFSLFASDVFYFLEIYLYRQTKKALNNLVSFLDCLLTTKRNFGSNLGF